MSRHLVVAIAYDQLCTFEMGCSIEIFALPRPELGVDWYRFAICSGERGELKAMGGLTIKAPYGLNILDRADTIIIPGWRNANERPPENLLRKLRSAHQRGARIATICSGVFVLAHAGILDGITVTTHWKYVDTLKTHFPRIKLNPDVLYVESGNILTSAGSSAGLDMLLHLVRQDYDSKTANQVAQRLVMPPHRDGGQAQFVPRPLPPKEKSRISQLTEWIRKNPTHPLDLKSLAKKASTSPRTLQRQFRDETGMSPQMWIIRERVARAKELLESSRYSISEIAEYAGFKSEESLRHHFRRIAQISPSTYRRQFLSLLD